MARHSVLCLLAIAASLLSTAPAWPEDEAPTEQDWYAAAVAAGDIRKAAYEKRLGQIVEDVNAARRDFADLPPLEWDVKLSEGHFRHARWLLHHMKEPWNSGGVADFHDEEPGSKLFHLEGRAAARESLIAVKYVKRREPFAPTESWLPTVAKRFPWLMRSATSLRAGYAEGVVPDGANFAGERWGVVVLSTNADPTRPGARTDGSDQAPVIVPKDGAQNVPLALVREVPDIVPKELDGKGDAKTELGFPLTFSFFGGQAVLSGAEVTLIRIEEVEIEEKKERRRPGQRKKKPKPKPKKPKTEIVETEVECHLSTPAERPLLEKPRTNANSIVVIPLEPLVAGATYRATLTCRTGGAGSEPQDVELVTTFTTAAGE